jgi:uncharacterized protein YegL
MTNPNLTECICLLDKSGSMYSLKGDVVGGYNKLIAEQKAIPGEANFSLIQFDTAIQTTYENMPVRDVPELKDKDYQPTGATALLDAVGNTITTVGKRLAAMPEDRRPGKVVLAIMTDGEENSSKEYSKTQIKNMITEHKDVWKWDILFIGAGIDAFAEAGSIGIDRSMTMDVDHNAKGIAQTFGCMSKSYTSTRSR